LFITTLQSALKNTVPGLNFLHLTLIIDVPLQFNNCFLQFLFFVNFISQGLRYFFMQAFITTLHRYLN